MNQSTQLPRPKKSGKDPALAGAVERAREAAIEEGGEDVGDYEGFVLEDTRLGTHYFQCTNPGYVGWLWAVTVARIPRSRTATVCESGLLPGPDALLAKEWVPWAQRLSPDDVRPTDRLPYQSDDSRLESGYTPNGDEEQDAVAIMEFALNRTRVATRETIDAAAQRWYASERGPKSSGSRAAGADCQTCAFLIPISGRLGNLFGVCINEWSPDDGKVVAYDHGCGAHSETDVTHHTNEWVQSDPVLDETELEVVDPDS
ncbi:MAG TPA: DUF3027 domain-containing protein [Beutenbergiaceae bacterium]|nr:DUF3027 domain-containing protein [Beutenbergiaceae bacterium]